VFQNGKIKHIIYQSSFLVITNTLDNYNSSKNVYPKNIYEHALYDTTKSAGLSLAYNILVMNRLPITIISPSHIYGGSNPHPEDFILTYTRELCETNKIVLPKNSNTNYDNWISVFDVIQAYKIIFSQGFNGKNYNPVNSSQSYTETELAQMIVLAVKNTTDYSKYIKYDNSIYTFIPNFKDYKISTNFLPNQFTTTNTFVEEVNKLAKCC
jgi:nucleoside-diphosphate-sugar epimerase